MSNTAISISGQGQPVAKRGVPAGLWVRCPGCQATVFHREAEKRLNVCPECDNHWYVPARQRIEQLFDPGTFQELFDNIQTADPLQFTARKPYMERVAADQASTGLSEAVVAGIGNVHARKIAFGMTDSHFMMGSMGAVVGERLTRLTEKATAEKLPLVIMPGSGGGARMHEGILALMQMAKISAALRRHHESGGLYIVVITNPTMGGVVASFAMLGDIIFAEPQALVGFAGPRTIQATLRMELPKGFQTSEFLLEHGYIDRIIHRKDLSSEIARAIDYCT